jgi:hypothetical protein
MMQALWCFLLLLRSHRMGIDRWSRLAVVLLAKPARPGTSLARRGLLASKRNALVVLLGCTLTGIAAPARSETAFEEVTTSAGMTLVTQTWGAAWGDCDSDGWPDLWIGNHANGVSLYRNDRDGTFTDIGGQLVYEEGDMHGAAWADFDNDGDQDLVWLSGAAGETNDVGNTLFVNQGGVFQDQAASLGVDYPQARSRNPFWLDWNGDGRLDLLVANAPRSDGLAPSTVFEQTHAGFVAVEVLPAADLIRTLSFAQLGDLSGDGVPELMTAANWPLYRILDTSSVPFADVTNTLGLGSVQYTMDAAIADLTGDLLPDLFLSRFYSVSTAVQDSPTTLKVRLVTWGEEYGVDIGTTGNLTIQEASWFIPLDEVFIGAAGWNPSSHTFTLSAGDPNTHGLLPHTPGVDSNVYIGYDPVSELWQLRVSNRGQYETLIEGSAPLTEVDVVGFELESGATEDLLFVQGPGGLTDATSGSGLGAPTECASVAAGDFDNDMDVDLYMVCSGSVTNLPNLLYENQGNGSFVEVPDAGGAAGSSLGRGDTVATADYDRDGFLDLFVSNGAGAAPLALGPHQLFRNLGNSNHWIEIDLKGVLSNRDGIGARVLVTAGGVTQLREQAGGMHAQSQNHSRVHFGLGSNTVVEQLVVEWPSGIVQQIDHVAGDRIFRVTEGAGVPLALGPWGWLALSSLVVGLAPVVLRPRTSTKSGPA